MVQLTSYFRGDGAIKIGRTIDDTFCTIDVTAIELIQADAIHRSQDYIPVLHVVINHRAVTIVVGDPQPTRYDAILVANFARYLLLSEYYRYAQFN